MLIPAMQKARDTARRIVCGNQVKQIGVGVTVYADSQDGFLPWAGGNDPGFKDPFFRCRINSSGTCPGDGEIHTWVAYRMAPTSWMRSDGTPKPVRLACLYEAGIIGEPQIFYCPSETAPLYRYKNYIKPLNPTDPAKWGVLPQLVNDSSSDIPGFGNQWVRVGYSYFPIGDNIPMNFLRQAPQYTPRKFDGMSNNVPYLTDRISGRNDPVNAPIEILRQYPKPFAHRMGGVYAVNALFKDGHTIYFNDQKAFNHDKWEPYETGQIYYTTFFYETFRRIGRIK